MLTDVQTKEIENLIQQNRFNEGYRYLLEASSVRDASGKMQPAPGVDYSSWVWLRGATDVNAGTGAANNFIREYTKRQMEYRTGEPVTDATLQDISNKIAKAVLTDAVDLKRLPDIARIGDRDASQTVDGIPGVDRAAWSGNILFLALGQNEPFKSTLLEKPGDTYDLLAAMKSGFKAFGKPSSEWFSQLKLVWNPEGDTAPWYKAWYTGNFSSFTTAMSESNSFLKASYGGIAPVIGTLTTERIYLGTLNKDSRVEGSSSGDYQIGGDKNDTLLSSAGNDIMDGRGGKDTADYSNADAPITVTIKTAAGSAKYTAA